MEQNKDGQKHQNNHRRYPKEQYKEQFRLSRVVRFLRRIRISYIRRHQNLHHEVEEQDEDKHHKANEELVVSFTDTVSDERAVMIHYFNTAVAICAVRCSRRSVDPTCAAVYPRFCIGLARHAVVVSHQCIVVHRFIC